MIETWLGVKDTNYFQNKNMQFNARGKLENKKLTW